MDAQGTAVTPRHDLPGVPAAPRRRRRTVSIALAALVVLGAAVTYAAWWSKPSTFGPIGNAYGFSQEEHPQPGDHALRVQPVTVNMIEVSAHKDPETVTLHGAKANVVTNTADADITLAYCTQRVPTMSAHGPLSRSCAEVKELAGQPMEVPSNATVMMTVTAHQAGKVVVRGIDVTYTRGARHLWQRGHELTGPVVRVRVEP